MIGFRSSVTCRVLNFSKQAFFKWRANPISQRDGDEAHLTNAAIDAHADDPTFGYRFIADDLAAAGHTASERRIWRLCSQQRIWSLHSKKRGLNRKAGPPVHDDGVQREFSALDVDRLWLTDITEHHRGGEAVSLRREGRVLEADRWVLDRLPDEGLPRRQRSQDGHRQTRSGQDCRSLRQGQFRSKKFVRTINNANLLGSMSQVGACADNAAMESFFSLLQKNVLNRQRWSSREQLRLAIVKWIEGTYHRKRRQRSLGKFTPIEYETILKSQAAIVA